MSIVDNEKRAILRNKFLKENSEKIKIEGIDADETYNYRNCKKKSC